MTQKQKCKKCNGTEHYMYDKNHIKVCDSCCTHPDGWWKMEKHYGNDNGKYACKKGCGTIVNTVPKSKKTDPVAKSEDDLMELTKNALMDVLGREPTKQEILRAHAGFKRMAFIMYEDIKRKEK